MITHSWNGTILTITTDSGTSSCDLKGDNGIRGPQGEAGIILDTTGEIALTGYATKEEMAQAINAAKGAKTKKLDFSTWNDGYFTETLETGEIISHVVEFDVVEGKLIGVGGIQIVGVE